MGRDLRGTDLFLWNPVSGDSKRLPPLSTLPFFNEFVDDAIKSKVDNMSCFIRRVQVFSIGTVECVVAIIFINPACITEEQHELALCTPDDDQSWNAVGGGGNQRLYYNDILFHDGKLYVSCELDEDLEVLDHDTIIRKGVHMVHLRGGCDVEVDMLRFVYEDIAVVPYEEICPIGFNTHGRSRIVEHLVESSSTGELLVVSAIQDLYSHNTSDDQVMRPIETFYCYQTRGFEVRRVTGTNCLEKMDIGEQGIFVGANGSLCLPTVDMSEVEAGCIYFATDDGKGEIGINRVWEGNIFVDDIQYVSEDMLYTVRERGIFNLRENTIRKISSMNLGRLSGSVTGWFTPKLV